MTKEWITNSNNSFSIQKKYITHIVVNEQKLSILVYILNIPKPFEFNVADNRSLWNIVEDIKKDI